MKVLKNILKLVLLLFIFSIGCSSVSNQIDKPSKGITADELKINIAVPIYKF